MLRTAGGRRTRLTAVAAFIFVALVASYPQPSQDSRRSSPAHHSPATVLSAPAFLDTDRLIPAPPDTFPAADAPPDPPPAQLQPTTRRAVQPAGGVWAVIIGINDYPGTRSDLHSAVNDANDVNDALAGFGVPSTKRLVLRDRQATAYTIRAAVDWLVAHASADATAVLFYAGHVRKLSEQTEAIVAADGRTITDAELARRMQPLRARSTWIGIAACYGGGFDELLKPGRVLTAAADANHLAYENDSLGHSYFVEYMVHRAMIRGDAPRTVQTAFTYAKDNLERDHPQRVPVLYDRSDGAVNLHEQPASSPNGTTATTPPTTAAPARPSPPPPPPQGDNRCAALTVGLVRCGNDDD